MAKRQLKRASGNGKAAAQASADMTIAVDPDADAPAYYVNYAAVSHTPHDFVIAAGQLPSVVSEATKERALSAGQVVLVPMVRLTVPTSLLPHLIQALTTQRDKYEKRFGPIPDVSAIKKAAGK